MAESAELILKMRTAEFNRNMLNTQNRLKSFGMQAMKVGGIMTAALTLPIAMFSKAAITAASLAEETADKFGTVFIGAGDAAEQTAQRIAKSYGIAVSTGKELLGNTGDILSGFGFTDKAALALSEKVAKLGIDLASFSNYAGGAKGAVAALTKALVGETESAKALGIVIRQNSPEYKKLVKEGMELRGETLLQAKAMAAFTIAVSQSQKAIGDAQRTWGSYANTMRRLEERTKELKESWGKLLINVLRLDVLMGKLSVAIKKVSNWLNGLSPTIRKVVVVSIAIVAALGPIILLLGTFAFAIGSIIAIAPAFLAGLSAVLPVLLSIGAATIILIASFKFLKAAWIGFSKGLQSSGIFKEMRGGFQAIKDGIKSIIPSMEVVIVFWKSLQIEIIRTSKYTALAFEIIGHNIGTVLSTAGKNIKAFMEFVADLWRLGFKGMWAMLKAFGRDVGIAFKGLAKEMWNAIRFKKTNFTGVFANMGKEWEREAAKLKIKLPEFESPDLKGLDDYKKQFKEIEDAYKKAMAAILNGTDGKKKTTGPINRIFGNALDLFNTAVKQFDDMTKTGMAAVADLAQSTAQPFTEAVFADTVEAQKAQFGISSTDKKIEKNTADTAKYAKKSAEANEKTARENTKPPIYKMA